MGDNVMCTMRSAGKYEGTIEIGRHERRIYDI